jgi:hypothetical protein
MGLSVSSALPAASSTMGPNSSSETVTFALDKLVLRLELDPAQIEIAIERLVGRERTRDQETLGEAVFDFEVVALTEEFAFFLLLGSTALVLVVPGVLALGLWEAVVDGAAIFELDLALLDSRFLDFEFSQRPRVARHHPGQGQRKRPDKQPQALRAAREYPIPVQSRPPGLKSAENLDSYGSILANPREAPTAKKLPDFPSPAMSLRTPHCHLWKVQGMQKFIMGWKDGRKRWGNCVIEIRPFRGFG